ncbi:MAG: hypothetical protein WBP83_07515 [Nitrososphaeraceae archaeon]|jgi:hypothetical protein
MSYVGTLSGLLLLCTILLNTVDDNQRLALAQITPAPEKSGSTDDSSTNSSPVSGDGNGDDQNDRSAGSLGADGNDGTDVDGVSEGATPRMNNKMKIQREILLKYPIRMTIMTDRV